jgi:hypothetical protein
MRAIENPPSSIFFKPDFWAYMHGKVAAITYHDGSILLGRIEAKKDEFPRIMQATITKPGLGEKWLGNKVIDMSQVKKVEVQG